MCVLTPSTGVPVCACIMIHCFVHCFIYDYMQRSQLSVRVGVPGKESPMYVWLHPVFIQQKYCMGSTLRLEISNLSWFMVCRARLSFSWVVCTIFCSFSISYTATREVGKNMTEKASERTTTSKVMWGKQGTQSSTHFYIRIPHYLHISTVSAQEARAFKASTGHLSLISSTSVPLLYLTLHTTQATCALQP